MGGWGKTGNKLLSGRATRKYKRKGHLSPMGSQFQHDPFVGLSIPPQTQCSSHSKPLLVSKRMFSAFHMLFLVPGTLFPHLFHGQISFILQGTQVRCYFLHEIHQTDLLSNRSGVTSGLPGSHGLPPSLQRDSGSVYQGHTSPQQACNKYWRSEIFRERGEPGVVREPQGRGGGPGWGQHLKEHSKNSSSWASLAALVDNELLITRSHTRRCQTLPPAAPLLHPQGASAKAHLPSSLCPAPSAPSCSMGLALPPLVKKAAQRVWAKGSQGCSHSFGQPSSFLKRPREP